MIISESEGFVFLHNPKTGGTSVRAALLPWDTRNNQFWGIAHDKASGWNVDKAHLPLHVLGRLYPEERKLADQLTSFGFCRHPLSRFLSTFNESYPELFTQVTDRTLSKDEYAGKLEEYACHLIKGGQWNPNFTHATPQKAIFYDGNKCVADLIIPIEKPFPKVRALRSLLGAPGEAVMACFEEKADRKNVRKLSFQVDELLTPQTLQNLHEFYSDDFHFFGYSN